LEYCRQKGKMWGSLTPFWGNLEVSSNFVHLNRKSKLAHIGYVFAPRNVRFTPFVFFVSFCSEFRVRIWDRQTDIRPTGVMRPMTRPH